MRRALWLSMLAMGALVVCGCGPLGDPASSPSAGGSSGAGSSPGMSGGSGSSAGSGGSGGPAALQVLLTDAPGPFDQVPVTIARVEVHYSGPAAVAVPDGGVAGEVDGDVAGDVDGGVADVADAGAADEADGGPSVPADGWVTLVDTARTYDLLQLQNGINAVLGGAGLPPGHYTQIRLILSSAEVVVGGTTYPLKVPSGAQTGFKLNYDFDVEPGATYALTLDFDAQASIKQTGAGYLLTPVLKVKSFAPVPAMGDDADGGAAGMRPKLDGGAAGTGPGMRPEVDGGDGMDPGMRPEVDGGAEPDAMEEPVPPVPDAGGPAGHDGRDAGPPR